MPSKNPFLAGIREEIGDLRRDIQGVVVCMNNKADRSELPPPVWDEESIDKEEEYSDRLFRDLTTIVTKLNEVCAKLEVRGLQWSNEGEVK